MLSSPVRIQYLKTGQSFEVEKGSNLMQAILENGKPVASSCNGDGVCAKCKIKVIQGQENLSPENQTEKFLKESNDIPNDFRISCQTEVLGNVLIDATYW